MLEAEISQLFAGSLAQLRDDFAAFRGEGLPGAPQLGVELLEFSVEPAQFGVALFQAL